ncbi:hypothetical protein AB0F30_16660 [Streptomyces sp. NPDC029006]|uniref:hypothetical protein n=1 Tax=Streptomyces sp. NPDC029006 TaxID=3155467 RepID=UPI0033CFA58B
MPIWAVCMQLGLPHESSLQHVLYGRGEYGPGEVVRRETAALVLAYWPTLADYPDTARIDPTGTRRRVEALSVLGWSRAWMARQIGMGEVAFKKAVRKERVTARLARQVAGLYDAWWNHDPAEHGVSANAAARVRADAFRSGYHGPLAWDDDTIDDPQAMPVTDSEEPITTEGGNLAARWLMGESVILDREARNEVLAHLFEWSNDTVEEIAARLGMSPEAADQAWFRMRRKARSEGRRLWRRVYVPRERTLKCNEMEKAA